MTPSDHYTEAERLLAEVADYAEGGSDVPREAADDAHDVAVVGALHAAALVHATLAAVPWPVSQQAAEQARERADA